MPVGIPDPERHHEPRHDTYDAIVVGCGIGGSTAAAMLARAGRRVLVVERQTGPGGYAHVFERGPYIFDPAIHVTGQGGEGQIFDSLLRHLGVRDEVAFLPVESYYAAAFPGLRLHLPIGFDRFIEAHAAEFPAEAENIRRFFRLCEQVHGEAHFLPPQLSFKRLDAVVAKFPVLFRYIKADLSAVLAEHIGDPRARAACVASWPYVGLPPSRLSFLTFTQMLFSQMEGTYYSRGSFQRLANALVTALERHGGELVLNTPVERIVIEDGRAAGVVLAGGREVRAPAVISNTDAKRTFEQLVGEEHLPAPYLRRLRRMKPSLSAFVLYAATDVDLRREDAAHETFIYRHWDHDETSADIERGLPGGVWLNVPTLLDPSLAPPGEHVLILTSLARYDIGQPWSDVRARNTDLLLAELAGLYPALRDRVRVIETATPLTLERYTLNQGGAIYGWEYLPDQTGSKRLAHRTPVPGLYLAGHWSQPGAASLRVLVSGIHTAQIVLAETGHPDLAAAFHPPDLPPAM